ncbi:MAG: FAD-binding domain-containing protein [Maribacter sp.]
MNTLFGNEVHSFPAEFDAILHRMDQIDPIKYGRTRNFVDGAVTYLAPYISRGVISTKTVLDHVLKKGYKPKSIEKFIQELAWRDYWQQVWIAKGGDINYDLKNKQFPVSNRGITNAIYTAKTGITAIDSAIQNLQHTGYMHNHERMYVASIACNISKSHWKTPAQWLYYHLLDADWASNALSWQWVAGANSHKKYYANQENINRYCHTQQKNTFLDVPYDKFEFLEVPETLREIVNPELLTMLPSQEPISIATEEPTFIYNFYNLDPNWKSDISGNRILLLEPSHFEAYPVSKKSIDFMLALSKNIGGIQLFVGEFDELITSYQLTNVHYKEHPLNTHYKGKESARDWMFTVKGYYPSFFGFWKKCKKELKY